MPKPFGNGTMVRMSKRRLHREPSSEEQTAEIVPTSLPTPVPVQKRPRSIAPSGVSEPLGRLTMLSNMATRSSHPLNSHGQEQIFLRQTFILIPETFQPGDLKLYEELIKRDGGVTIMTSALFLQATSTAISTPSSSSPHPSATFLLLPTPEHASTAFASQFPSPSEVLHSFLPSLGIPDTASSPFEIRSTKWLLSTICSTRTTDTPDTAFFDDHHPPLGPRDMKRYMALTKYYRENKDEFRNLSGFYKRADLALKDFGPDHSARDSRTQGFIERHRSRFAEAFPFFRLRSQGSSAHKRSKTSATPASAPAPIATSSMSNLDQIPAPLSPPYQYQSEGTSGREVSSGNAMEDNDEENVDDDERNIGLHNSGVGDVHPDGEAILGKEDQSEPLHRSQPLVPVPSNMGLASNDVERSPPQASILAPILVSGRESTTTSASTLVPMVPLSGSIQSDEAPDSAAAMDILGESTATPLNSPPLAPSAGDLQLITALSAVDKPDSKVAGVMPGIPLAMSPSGQSIEDDATELETSDTDPGLSLVEAVPATAPASPPQPPQPPQPPSSSSTVFLQTAPLTISLWRDFARKCEDPVCSSWVQDAVRRGYGNQPFTSRPLHVPVSTDRTIKIDFAARKYYLPEFSVGSDALAAELLIDAIMGLFDTDECEDWERVGDGDPFGRKRDK